MQNQELCKQIEQQRIIAIVRKIYGDDLLFLTETLISAGIATMEVTFDQQDMRCEEKTAHAIRSIQDRFKGDCICGAGTVLTCAQADIAADAGASLIISPNCDESVIRHTKARGLLSIPGCLTPSEIVAAHQAGADYIKLFPVANLGTSYIKNVSSPISHVKFLAVGGVNIDNFSAFLTAGCVGAGIGGSLANRDLIQSHNRERLIKNATQYVSAVRAFDKGENK